MAGTAPPLNPPTASAIQSQQAERDSLGDQRESLRADGRTGDKLDEDVAQGRREVGTCDLLQHGAEGVDVGGLTGWVPRACVQDVPSVQHQQQDMRLAGALWADFLKGTPVGTERHRQQGDRAGEGQHNESHTHTQVLWPEKQARCPACPSSKSGTSPAPHGMGPPVRLE